MYMCLHMMCYSLHVRHDMYAYTPKTQPLEDLGRESLGAEPAVLPLRSLTISKYIYIYIYIYIHTYTHNICIYIYIGYIYMNIHTYPHTCIRHIGI